VRAFLLNQNPERLTQQTLSAVTTNRSHLLATALNARAAALIAKEWGGRPDATALARLPRYRFLAQVTDRGEATKPFLVAGVPIEELHGAGRPAGLDDLERAIDRTCARRPATEAIDHLERLDERILAELRGRHRSEAAGEPPRTEAAAAEDAEPAAPPRRRPLRVPTRRGAG
jgi:hypothetical protein